MICFGWFHVWDQGDLKCLRCVEVLGQRGLESRGTCAMWVIVQVENVSTCVVEEADMNDFGVLLSSENDSQGLFIISRLSWPTFFFKSLLCSSSLLSFILLYCICSCQQLYFWDAQHACLLKVAPLTSNNLALLGSS